MKRILIISASAGGGHVTAARAIEQALSQNSESGRRLEVEHIDLLTLSSALYKMIYHDIYLYMAKKTPLLYGYIFTASDQMKRQRKPDAVRRFIDSINSRRFRKHILEKPWDVIVSTHYLPSQLICELKRRGKTVAPLVTVTTDYGLHAYWILSECEHYVVADDYNRAHLVSMGIPGERIHNFGIPVLPVFGQAKDPAELRTKYDLRTDLPVVLLLAGGFGVSPIEQIVGWLENCKSSFQLIAVTGRNKKLYRSLREAARRSRLSIKVVGFTDAMDEYMKCSDLVITKPGGLTTAEAMACGLPVMVINPIPGQEDMNSDMLLENGAGVKAEHLIDVPYKLEQVLSHPRKLASLKSAARKLARPQAAHRTAELILKIAGEQDY